MSLVVEDGTGLANSETYNSLVTAEAYMLAHGSPEAWAALATDAKKEAALRYGSRWMDGHYRWLGSISHPETPQAKAFPRVNLVDSWGRFYDSDEIPQAIKDLECEAALYHLKKAVNTVYERGGQIQSRSAEGASISYFEGASVTPVDPYLDDLAAPFVGASNVLLRA